MTPRFILLIGLLATAAVRHAQDPDRSRPFNLI